MTARPIKALSAQNIDDLRNGRGMGQSMPAELNGYPGPKTRSRTRRSAGPHGRATGKGFRLVRVAKRRLDQSADQVFSA